MEGTPAEAAVLVVRVWREQEVPGFRARVTYCLDITASGETVATADSPERLHALVQEWLDGFLTGTPG